MDPRRKRLLYISQHRGMKETDLLLGRFAERHLERLTEDQIARFAAILDESDNDLLDWITGKKPVPADHDNDVMALIRNEIDR